MMLVKPGMAAGGRRRLQDFFSMKDKGRSIAKAVATCTQNSPPDSGEANQYKIGKMAYRNPSADLEAARAYRNSNC